MINEQAAARRHRLQARQRHNEEFFQKLQQRRPDAKDTLDELVKIIGEERDAKIAARAETVPPEAVPKLALETLVSQERPVLFVEDDWINKTEVTIKGMEAQDLIEQVERNRTTLQPLVPLIGRIDVAHFPGSDYVGTGWLVAQDIVVTNRHVASLIARWDGRRFMFRRGVAGKPIEASLGTAHEFDDLVPDQSRCFPIKEVLYIEGEAGPDIAFLRVQRRTDGTRRSFIPIAESDIGDNVPVLVMGYPARASKSVIPDQDLMRELFRDRYDVKRAAPGYTMAPKNAATRHDCTTLGGNSGSVVLDLKNGRAVGLHFAGLYQESNYAVPASVLSRYIRERAWQRPPLFEVNPPVTPMTVPQQPMSQPQSMTVQAASDGAVAINIPLSITVQLGVPGPGTGTATGYQASTMSTETAEATVRDFWDQRPDGVIAARLGFAEENGEIGNTPFIAASVPADQLAAAQASACRQFGGLNVRYFPADVAELLDSLPEFEAVESISYDNDARTGDAFSFDTVEEDMTVRAHVGPEYSWAELKAFLTGAKKKLVSAIYEFHGKHIAEVLEERLGANVALELVMDNSTFSKLKDTDEEFDRVSTFQAWEGLGDFARIVVPEGADGLIANAYHIKVTVREDDTFWLSSGNWKMASSQPVITEEQLAQAADADLPGNREWHVVITNPTLAGRFRSHIQQDFTRSKQLGGGELPKSHEAPELFVDVPIEPLAERRPPVKILKPREISGTVRVKPLLTPDKEGAVYCDAVLDLIRGARESLLFQIPYIGMPSNPREDRGYIDELIKALAQKLKDLDDARLILRVGGSAFSSPAHTAWYLKSKGVDIKKRVQQIEDHHTKGMIVDGKRVLLGSHNWSKPGVTLNRDASLLFDNADIAAYFADAFEIDWARAKPINPKQYVKQEGVLRAIGEAPPGYRRVRLSDLVNEQD